MEIEVLSGHPHPIKLSTLLCFLKMNPQIPSHLPYIQYFSVQWMLLDGDCQLFIEGKSEVLALW